MDTNKSASIAAAGEAGTLNETADTAGFGGAGGVKVVGSYAPRPVYEAPGAREVVVADIPPV